MAVTAIH